VADFTPVVADFTRQRTAVFMAAVSSAARA
jgi:hypothetical protein